MRVIENGRIIEEGTYKKLLAQEKRVHSSYF